MSCLILNCDRLSYSADLYNLIMYVSFLAGKYNDKKNKKGKKSQTVITYILFSLMRMSMMT